MAEMELKPEPSISHSGDDEVVKEYHPKRRAKPGNKANNHVEKSGDRLTGIPIVSRTRLEGSPEDGIVDMEGGVMMTTSEIFDFSEGTDSTP